MSNQPRKTLEERAQMSDLERLRHSTAHIMATAILRIWPEAQFAYGPPVDSGFYYDFDLPHRVTPEDFPRIEEEMKKVIKENQRFDRQVISRAEAIKLAESGRLGGLSDREGNPSRFKLDLLDKIPDDEEISLYQNGAFLDLCAGPHVNYTSKCKNFRLTSVSSSYYLGKDTNPQLQRLYGTAFPSKEELEQHFLHLEEAKKRDHRKLGRELNLFHIDEEVGQGLILWMPDGATIRHELETFISGELRKQGYSQVYTPHIGKLDLYRTSGHFPYYQESQYPPVIERESLEKMATEGCSCGELSNRLSSGDIDGYLLKPMNCPHHIKIFASRHHSYRELPVRLAEFGTVYRWEQSGELGGLTRVRSFTQDDAHLFCAPDQVEAEIMGCLDLVKTVLGTLGMDNYRVRVSLRDPDSNKYVGKPENWDKAEDILRRSAATLGVPFTEEPGEAAFYGPKIDFVVKDVLGREWQLGTIQLDYNLPERFDLNYTGPDNHPHRPVMIHRAPFGSLERFTGVLIEHFAGHFPTWLSPEQVRVLTVSEKSDEHAQKVFEALKAAGIRVKADFVSDKIGAKIRRAQLEKAAYMLVIGEKELVDGTVTIRHRQRGDLGTKTIAEFIADITAEIQERRL